MDYLAFRNLVGVSHTEAEAKALAEEVRSFRRLGIRNQAAGGVYELVPNPQPTIPMQVKANLRLNSGSRWASAGSVRPDRRVLHQL